MSLDNATLTRVDAPPAIAPGGDVAPYIPGASIGVRCTFDEPNFLIRRLIDDLQLESVAVVYVELSTMPNAASLLVVDAQLVINRDRLDQVTLRIDHVSPFVFGRVSHLQCLARSA